MKPTTLLFSLAALAAAIVPAAAFEQFDLGGAAKGVPTTVAYEFAGDEAIAVFVRGPADLMYAKVTTGGGNEWTEWAPIGKLAMKGDPSCAARSLNRVDCAAIGPNNNVYWTSYDAKKNSWTGWANLGGLATSNPSVITTREGGKAQLRVFVRGPANHLFMNTLTGGNWTDWQDRDGVIGVTFACSPISTLGAHCYDTSGGKALQLMDITHKTGNAVVVDDLGGIITGKAAPAAYDDSVHLFVLGPGHTLWEKVWSNGWTDWHDTKAPVGSAPGCAMNTTGDEAWCATVTASGAVTMYRLQ